MNEFNRKSAKYLSYKISGNSKYPKRYLYIFKRHDISLLCWLKEKIRLENHEPFFLLTIDNHLDLPTYQDDWKRFLVKLRDIKEIKDIQNRLSYLKENFQSLFGGQDVHFILAALVLKLISGALIISPGTDKKNLIESLKERFNIQDIFSRKYISSLFYPPNRSILNDMCDNKKRKIRKKLKHKPLLFDLDLDYFTYGKDDMRFAISDNHFNWLFSKKELINLFLEDAVCITIALEPLYCNFKNQENCKIIFNRFMNFFRRINLIDTEIKYEEVIRVL